MADPLFWLVASLLLFTVSLTTVLLVAVPTLRELGRAARSAEKLLDILGRELPPTLEAIRRTGLEISDLTDDVSTGVQSAGRVVQQVDQSLMAARQQAQVVHRGSRSLLTGILVAWQVWSQNGDHAASTTRPRSKKLGHQRSSLAEPRHPNRTSAASNRPTPADSNRTWANPEPSPSPMDSRALPLAPLPEGEGPRKNPSKSLSPEKKDLG